MEKKRVRRAFLTVVFLLAIGDATGIWAQSSSARLPWLKLSDKAKIYLALSDDILQMLDGKQGSNDFEFALGLETSAKHAMENFTAASDLIWIYNQMGVQRERDAVRPLINKRLDSYSQLLDVTIKEVNSSLSHITSPGIVATGTRLRDELRDGQSLLNTVKVK
jgi:hypothetical protein